MPEMELFSPDLPLFWFAGIWNRLFAYMCWPNDEGLRKAHCARPVVRVLSLLDQLSTACTANARIYDIAHRAFRQMGGWEALDNAGFPNGVGCAAPLYTAAAVLEIISRTPGEKGSLNKAVHIIENTPKAYWPIGYRGKILRAWRSHRSVAHLGIAFLHVIAYRDPNDYGDPRRLARFIAIANYYHHFATTYRPPNQQTPLIAEAEIWSFPAALQVAATHRLGRVWGPLADDMLAALSTYQAPR
jgi:hypothetical protein